MLILPEEVRRERLISDEYRKLQAELHEDPSYGEASAVYAPMVAQVINQYGVEALLDYGAGKGRLARTIAEERLVQHRLAIQMYEPADPDMADPPDPAEMVACIDVLEHIEPELLDNVLDDLQRCTLSIGLFTIATVPAVKTLPDGRNAHLIIQPPSWWLPRIMERFELQTFQKSPEGFVVLVSPLQVAVQGAVHGGN